MRFLQKNSGGRYVSHSRIVYFYNEPVWKNGSMVVVRISRNMLGSGLYVYPEKLPELDTKYAVWFSVLGEQVRFARREKALKRKGKNSFETIDMDHSTVDGKI